MIAQSAFRSLFRIFYSYLVMTHYLIKLHTYFTIVSLPPPPTIHSICNSIYNSIQHFLLHSQLIFIAGAVLSLVPTPLFEIRYFNPVIVIAMLSMSPLTRPSMENVHHESTENDDENLTQKKERNFCVHFGTAYHYNLYIIMSGFCIINLITIYVFLYKPFRWKNGSVARFMY